MPSITGIGWIYGGNSGEGRKNTRFKVGSVKLPPISRKTFFQAPYPRFNRMDEFSRLGVSVIGLALQDAGMDEWTAKRAVGVVVSTVYGCLHTDLDYFETVIPEQGAFASPALFSYTLPNCFLGEAAARFGLTGPGYVVSQSDDTGLSSVKAVLEDMDCMGLKTALAGTCDLGRPPGFPVAPNITPGAAFMVVESQPRTELDCYGTIHLNRAQEILFNGSNVSGFRSLIESCLKQMQKSGK